MAVADALLQFGSGLEGTLRWSCYQPCELSGNIESIPLSWEMTGDDTAGVTLTIKSGDVIPEISDGEHWKENQVCYEAITKLDLGSVTEIGTRATPISKGFSPYQVLQLPPSAIMHLKVPQYSTPVISDSSRPLGLVLSKTRDFP